MSGDNFTLPPGFLGDIADLVERLKAENAQLREALAEYGSVRNWSLSRDELEHRVCAWIGPGSEERPVPNGPKIAREALEATATKVTA